VYKIRDLVEKPPREEAPSDLAIIGRYILTPDLFGVLSATREDRTGEIQLTKVSARSSDNDAVRLRGERVRHDTGNKLGFIKAAVYFALKRPDWPGRSAIT